MYIAKAITSVSVSESALFRTAYADLMTVLRARCRTPYDVAEGLILDGDREVCYIKCFSDCYLIHYAGYNPMWFRWEG